MKKLSIDRAIVSVIGIAMMMVVVMLNFGLTSFGSGLVFLAIMLIAFCTVAVDQEIRIRELLEEKELAKKTQTETQTA